jgi:exonuclease SbcD
MASPRFLHAADLHLGAPLLSLGQHIAPELADHFRSLSRRALDLLVDAAIEHGVDFVVLAGDIYDGAHREVSAQVRFAAALERLEGAGIAVFIVHGNHDPLVRSYRPAAALPPNVTVFPPGEVAVHRIEVSDGTEVCVAGTSFSSLHERRNLAADFARIDTGGHRCVAVLHANVDSTVGHDPYAPCSVEDLAAAPVHYWALGHVHLRTVQSLGFDRWWAYSGNLQGRSTKASECGPKGALVADLTADGVGEPTFVACDALRFERIEADVSAATDVPEVLEIASGAVAAAVASAGSVPLLVRVGLHGASAAHDALIDGAPDLLELFREAHGDCVGSGAIVSVRPATAPAIDRAQLLDRRDLLAAVLQRIDESRAEGAPAVESLILADLDQVIPHRRTRDLIESVHQRSPDFAAEVLDAVEQRLINELVERR